jgi:hypothetical protein
MAILRKAPLEERIEERISDLRAECDAEIDARVAVERKRLDYSVPDTMVRAMLTSGIGDPILAYMHIKQQEDEQKAREGAAA